MRLPAELVEIDYQELLFHEKAIGDKGFYTAGSHEFGEGMQSTIKSFTRKHK